MSDLVERRREKTYDPACYALAEHFHADKQYPDYDVRCDELASEIQRTIEGWFSVMDEEDWQESLKARSASERE